MKKIILLLALVVTSLSIGQGISKKYSQPKLQFGQGTSNRELVFDYTEDANSVKLIADDALNELTIQAKTTIPETVTITDTLNANDVTASQVVISSTTLPSHVFPSMSNTDRDNLTGLVEGDCVWSTTDQITYCYDGTSWNELGAGGGGGLDVYHTEDYEKTLTTDWATGNNATILGGGSLVGALATTQDIAGDVSFKYTHHASSATVNDYFCSAAITLDKKQKQNDSSITLYYTYDGADDDIQVIVWDVTNSKALTSTLDLVKNAGEPTRYNTTFYPPSNATDIRYCFQVLVTNANKVLVFDDTELSTNPFVYKNLVDINSFQETGNGGQVIGGASTVPFGSANSFGWDGDEYTVQKDDSVITIRANVHFSVSTTRRFDLHLNGVDHKRVSDDLNLGVHQINYTSKKGEFQKGDVIKLVLGSGSGTLVNSADNHYINIVESYQTEHVVTPAKANSEYYGTVGEQANFWDSTGNIQTFDISLIPLTDSKLIEWNDTTETRLQAKEDIIVNVSVYADVVSGNEVIIYDSSANILNRNAEPNTGYPASVSTEIKIDKGDYIYFRVSNANTRRSSMQISARPAEANFLAAIPVQKVATIATNTGTLYHQSVSATASYKTINLESVSGESSFVSIASNQFSLGEGKYLIEHEIGVDGATGWMYSKLYNVTDAVDVKEYTNVCYGQGSSNPITFSTVKYLIEVVGSKTYELQTRAGGASGTEKHGPITITKLR